MRRFSVFKMRTPIITCAKPL